MELPNACKEEDCSNARSEHIVLEIRRRLCSAGYHALRLIECEYCDGVVVLRGRVPTYYFKQVAQSLLMNDRLIRTVVNLIEVSENGHGAFRS